MFLLLLFSVLGFTSAARTCYGDINNLSPTGRKFEGVTKSNSEVQTDLTYLNRYRSCYQTAADKLCNISYSSRIWDPFAWDPPKNGSNAIFNYFEERKLRITRGIQASVIAAVASRESRGGSLLEKTNGYGDGGKAYGIMQCDIKKSGLPCTSVSWNSCAHIQMMTGALITKINEVKKKFPKWPAERQLQGGVAAYNFGSKNVQSWSGLDVGSTNDDYSNDVIARAKYLYSIGWN